MRVRRIRGKFKSRVVLFRIGNIELSYWKKFNIRPVFRRIRNKSPSNMKSKNKSNTGN